VDEVLGVRRLDTAALAPTPSTVAQAPDALTSSMFEYDGRGVGLLDDEKLFAALERCTSW
jgi:chemotaxis-related protein WspD